MKTIVELNFYSPRQGHEDRYTFEFDENEMYASMGGPKEARATKNANGTIDWTGHNQGTGNPLLNILHDDSIYPPDIFIKGLMYAWDSWVNGELSDEQFESELTILADWVNEGSRNKPDSDYWITQF